MSTAKSAKMTDGAARADSRADSWARYKHALHYSLHVITHPFDGFWELTREGHGTMAAANTFLILFLVNL